MVLLCAPSQSMGRLREHWSHTSQLSTFHWGTSGTPHLYPTPAVKVSSQSCSSVSQICTKGRKSQGSSKECTICWFKNGKELWDKSGECGNILQGEKIPLESSLQEDVIWRASLQGHRKTTTPRFLSLNHSLWWQKLGTQSSSRAVGPVGYVRAQQSH